MHKKELAVIEEMMIRGLLPRQDLFEVTNHLIDNYYQIHGSLFSVTQKRMKKSDIKYAKKLAGLTLMKLNNERAGKTKTVVVSDVPKQKCGIIYLISNPAFPGMYKVGITQNLDKRLATYQTGDPHRRYKVEHYKFVLDIREEENKYLDQFKTDIVKGEWVSSEKVKELFIGL